MDLKTGVVLQLYALPSEFFGEGIAVYRDEIVQLTWRSNRGFVYDKRTFRILREFSYPTEGWGITCNGACLIMSDGTANLYFLNPETFQEVGRIQVHDKAPVTQLNELEYIKGEIFANVWQTDRIARIDPVTGQVLGWIDLSGIYNGTRTSPDDVLNGIAYDAVNNRVFVTGKRWSQLFEIRIVPVVKADREMSFGPVVLGSELPLRTLTNRPLSGVFSVSPSSAEIVLFQDYKSFHTQTDNDEGRWVQI